VAFSRSRTATLVASPTTDQAIFSSRKCQAIGYEPRFLAVVLHILLFRHWTGMTIRRSHFSNSPFAVIDAARLKTRAGGIEMLAIAGSGDAVLAELPSDGNLTS